MLMGESIKFASMAPTLLAILWTVMKIFLL